MSRSFREAGASLLLLIRHPGGAARRAARNPLLPALALLCLGTVPLLIPLADLALARIYPPVKEEKLFGLFSSTRPDERLKARKVQARWLLWALGGGASATLLFLSLPKLAGGGGPAQTTLDLGGKEAGGGGPGPASPPAGTPVEGRYRIERELGRGGAGVVYRALDTVLKRPVALKELPGDVADNPEACSRFRREALAAARLSHPGIVQVYDLIEENGRLYLALEFVDGGSLAALVEREGRLPLSRACSLGKSVAEALAYVHSQGVVHRDLKPANILLTRDGSPKITDFGVARVEAEGDITRNGAFLGTPNFMSPEQVAGREVDSRADLYSFGVLLYWLVAGALPFVGNAGSVMVAHLQAIPPPPSSLRAGVPPGLDSLIVALLAKDPDRRPSDLSRVAKDLARFG